MYRLPRKHPGRWVVMTVVGNPLEGEVCVTETPFDNQALAKAALAELRAQGSAASQVLPPITG
jgi:hypothetical protein